MKYFAALQREGFSIPRTIIIPINALKHRSQKQLVSDCDEMLRCFDDLRLLASSKHDTFTLHIRLSSEMCDKSMSPFIPCIGATEAELLFSSSDDILVQKSNLLKARFLLRSAAIFLHNIPSSTLSWIEHRFVVKYRLNNIFQASHDQLRELIGEFRALLRDRGHDQWPGTSAAHQLS
ncbi:hypothetical protein ADUPG1_011464, partial [Aduncisulcus paluster]